jgi:hypothetical protein
MPISLHALITRKAISPRFAIKTLRNMSQDAFHQTRRRYFNKINQLALY